MKKMFTLLALTLIVSMATFAQKPLYGTAATPQKAEKSLKVTKPNAKRVASKPMMAETSKNGTPIKASKALAAAKAPEVVTPPENADVLYYTLEGNYYTYSQSGWMGPYSTERTVKVVFDDNDVYVSGLFHYITDAYVKGSTEDGETVTFPMGQYLGTVSGYDLYSGAQDDEGKFIDMTATYDAETGVFTFNTIAGTCAVNDKGELDGLYALGDEGITLTPAGEGVLVPIEPPSSLTTEEYLFKGDNYFADSGEDPTVSRIVNVGFYGNDVYIQGFSGDIPDAWIKGTLTDGKYVFALGEYLGKYYDIYDLQLAGYTGKNYSDISFIYDATEHKFTATTPMLGNIFYDPEEESYYWSELFNGTITITKIVEKAATPVKPTIQNIGFGYYGDYLDFAINMTDTEGNGLLPSKVAYKLWSEDELGSQSEVTLSTADYEKLDADLTEIPYTFSDGYDIYKNLIYLNMKEHKSWVRVGLQTIYNGGGEKHESEITWYEIPWYKYISDEEIPSDMPITANAVNGTTDPDKKTAFTGTVNVGLYGEGQLIYIQGILPGTKMWTVGLKDGNTYKMINGCYLADYRSEHLSLYLIGYDSATKKIEAPVLEIDETNGVYKMKNEWIINADYTDKLYYFEWINSGTTIAINGEDTGISEVRANKAAADNKVYNLAGQQVGKDYKGLIIKNGKKFINK